MPTNLCTTLLWNWPTNERTHLRHGEAPKEAAQVGCSQPGHHAQRPCCPAGCCEGNLQIRSERQNRESGRNAKEEARKANMEKDQMKSATGTETTKLCMNCTYFVENRPDAKESQVECSHPGNAEPDYVRGGTKHFFLSAAALRVNRGLCGPTGACFQPGVPFRPVEPHHEGFFVRWGRAFGL